MSVSHEYLLLLYIWGCDAPRVQVAVSCLSVGLGDSARCPEIAGLKPTTVLDVTWLTLFSVVMLVARAAFPVTLCRTRSIAGPC